MTESVRSILPAVAILVDATPEFERYSERVHKDLTAIFNEQSKAEAIEAAQPLSVDRLTTKTDAVTLLVSREWTTSPQYLMHQALIVNAENEVKPILSLCQDMRTARDTLKSAAGSVKSRAQEALDKLQFGQVSRTYAAADAGRMDMALALLEYQGLQAYYMSRGTALMGLFQDVLREDSKYVALSTLAKLIQFEDELEAAGPRFDATDAEVEAATFQTREDEIDAH